MSPERASSSRGHLGAGLLIAAAALAYGAHIWIVRADVAARNAVLPSLGAVYLLLYFWGLGVALERLPGLRRDDAGIQPLLLLALGMGAGAIAILGLGSIGLLRLSVFAPLSAFSVVFGLRRKPPWRWRPSRRSPRGALESCLLAVFCAWGLLVLVLAFLPDSTWD